jgi:hypothetical protein
MKPFPNQANHMRIASAGILMVLCGLTGCTQDEEANCVCTREIRYNICVSWDGTDTLPQNLTFVREHKDGTRDTLERDDGCFAELRARQRILALEQATPVDSSTWFTPATVDCCHGMATIVDLGN